MRALMLPLLGLTLMAAAPDSGMEAIRAAATAGNVSAQFALGQYYQLGQGVPVDKEAAISWYRRAAAQGHAGASDELGFLLFARGDRREAIPYIEKAGARGEPRAFYLLGTAHFNGDLVARDWPLAYAQTSRAAEAGLSAAKTNLEMMGHYLLPVDMEKAMAILATLPPVRRAGPPTPLPPAPAPAPPPPAPPPAPVTKTGAWKVQLGAFGSVDRARAGWTTLSGKVSALAKLDQKIVAAGAVQRLQAAGLPDKAAADALCRQVRAAKGDCLVIAP